MRRLLTGLLALCLLAPAAIGQTLVLGNPSGDAAAVAPDENNYPVTHTGFILSYNRSRGTNNWVAWHLSGPDLGPVDRTNAFAADEALPAAWRVGKNDYNGSGYDRGHMCPSEDRTTTDEANRETFLMSNMQPQLHRLNGGTWKSLEGYVQGLARQGFEIYLYAGCYGNNGRVNGKVTIPTHCWKIAIVLPEGKNDKSRINCSTRVIAVDMPNEQSIVSGWRNYRTTIADIETSTGLNFLSTLPAAKRNCLRSKTDTQ